MWLTSFIFGVFVVVTFTEFPIHTTAVPFLKLSPKGNVTHPSVDEGNGNKIHEWVDHILQKRSTTTLQANVCPPCKCGLASMQFRIFGGVKSKKEKYPWMAQLIVSRNYHCGASVINSRYVLTAAHCLNNISKDGIIVRIGDDDRSSITRARTQDFGVEKIIKHRSFYKYTIDNDIALIKVKGSISFEGSMRPVCLAEKGLSYSGKKGIIVGWGSTDDIGPLSNILLEATVPIMTNTECRSTNYYPSRITDNMMCAGYSNGGIDACQGDSGGPLHVINQRNKVYHLVGIVSWGEGCAIPNLPGVYTRVNRYLTWLKRNTADACYCD